MPFTMHGALTVAADSLAPVAANAAPLKSLNVILWKQSDKLEEDAV